MKFQNGGSGRLTLGLCHFSIPAPAADVDLNRSGSLRRNGVKETGLSLNRWRTAVCLSVGPPRGSRLGSADTNYRRR